MEVDETQLFNIKFFIKKPIANICIIFYNKIVIIYK